MDIRTKLVFTFMAASLGSMLVLGAIMYSDAEQLLTDSTHRQLEGLADARKERVEGLISDWRHRVRLVAALSRLREGLAENGPGSDARIRPMLEDALDSSETFEAITAFDVQGRPIASAPGDLDEANWPARPPERGGTSGEPILIAATLSNGRPLVAFDVFLERASRPVGSLRFSLDGRELLSIANHRGGPGETLVVARDESGSALLLTPFRQPPEEGWTPPPDGPIAQALSGEDGGSTGGTVDHRGQAVWAATRHLADVGWGVVVLLDAATEAAPIASFRADLREAGIMLAAFAIALGIVVGLRFAKPIHDLAEVTNRIRDGELDARATVRREDEIGLLGRTLNDMADELERRMTLLLEFKQFFDMSLDMLCIAGTDGYFKRVNPSFRRTLGWTEEELLDKPFFDLVHPEDLESTQREVDKLAQGIPTISFENRFRCADGTYKLLHWTSHPEPETGLLFAVAREIDDGRS